MVNIIVEISGYLLAFLMAVYTYLNFSYFRFRDREKKRLVCRRQTISMFLFHGLANMVLYLNMQDIRVLLFYIAQTVFLAAYIYLYRIFYRNVSRLLVNNMCMLMSIGFVMLARLSFERATRQFVIIAAAALATWIIPCAVNQIWQLAKLPWLYGTIGLLLLAVVWQVGNSSFGAQLSLAVGGFSFQPSEFVKISFVFFVAAMFYRSTDFKTVAVTTAVVALHVLILVYSKDLGSALIFFITYLCMLFVATSNWGYFGAGLAGGAAASAVAYYLFYHVQVRVAAWRNPWADIEDRGYQITQSLFAIGTGGWMGLGLCQGIPWKIPVVEKDFIFAAIAEELGGIVALCVVLICVGCFLQFMMIAGKMQAMFYKLIAFGLGIVYLIQVFLNVGGVIKFIPSTGVTLPLISYGGSSALSTFILFGVIQGLYILKQNEEEEYEEREAESEIES